MNWRFSRRRWLQAAASGTLSVCVPLLARSSAPSSSVWPIDWRVGDVRITKILDVVERFDAARAFPGVDLRVFDQEADWIKPWFYDPVAKAIIFSFHSYLLRTAGLTMIVDTSFGEDMPLRPEAHHGAWLANLAAAGVAPTDVDVVTCTHFHGDHVGWNTRYVEGAWRPTFPRARYLFSRPEVDSVISPTGSFSAPELAYRRAVYEQSIRPVLEAGVAEQIDGIREVAPGIRIVPAHGHTPGHQCVEIASRGQRAVLAGDILHNPIEVLHPEWSPMFDDDKAAAMAQRRRFVEAHCDADITIFAAHFSGPTAGRIVTVGGRRIFRTLAV